MADETKIPPGGKVEITLRRKRKPSPKAARTADARGIVPVDDETPRYLRRGQVEIVYLDLATRLRSVPPTTFTGNRIRLASDTGAPARSDDYFNEYVEQVYELPRAPGFHNITLYTPAEIALLTASLLGARLPGSPDALDPLSTTEANVSGRKLFNCQPLPHSAGYSHVWAGVNDKEFRLADGTAGDNVGGLWADLGAEEWTRRTASDQDALEKWNPLNLQFSNAPHTAGRLRPKLARVTRLRQFYKVVPGFGEVWGAYERFDTGDLVNFKITGAPAFAAPDIPFSMGRGEVRVYLVPRMTLHTFQTGAGTPYNANPYRWHARMMAYPDAWLSQAGTQAELRRRALCFILRSPLAGAAFAAVTPTITPIYSVPQFFVFSQEYPASISLAGMLSAVIAQGGKVFYVWRRTSATLNYSTSFNPYAGSATLDTPCT
jgi:hypothetical protein